MGRNLCFTVSWFNHCSAECLDKFPKSTTVVKFPYLASQGCYEMNKMERKSNLKVKNPGHKPSYLQRKAFRLILMSCLNQGPTGTTLGWEGGESSC